LKRAALFEKVSEARFTSHADSAYYQHVALPLRATKGAAGYDFITPVPINLAPGESITVPTGIRAKIDSGVVLMLYPRSGLGFKYGMRLSNTTGVIDSDYYFADNEGHILVRIKNGGDKPLRLNPGERFCQGVFMPFFITYDDEADKARSGGFGSTGLA